MIYVNIARTPTVFTTPAGQRHTLQQFEALDTQEDLTHLVAGGFLVLEQSVPKQFVARVRTTEGKPIKGDGVTPEMTRNSAVTEVTGADVAETATVPDPVDVPEGDPTTLVLTEEQAAEIPSTPTEDVVEGKKVDTKTPEEWLQWLATCAESTINVQLSASDVSDIAALLNVEPSKNKKATVAALIAAAKG